jgi:hypoxanthine phosphoribosyltransferase
VHQDLERILFREDEIRTGIERLAREITDCYEGRPLTVVAVLKGSILFTADLVRRLPLPLEMAFASASSYGGGTTPGELRVSLLPTDGEIAGRYVLLVDDILDTGRTLARLVEEVRARGAREVRTCVFLDKPTRRTVDLRPDWRCFEVEDAFVVGYGLDLAGRYRNLPFVAALRREVLESAAQEGWRWTTT